MAGVPRSNDYESRIQRLERAVGILQRQSTLTSASIGEGGLTVRDNGEIRGIGTGKLDWNGPAHFGGNTDIGGQLDVTGNTHISGNLLIDGDTTLGGHLIFAPGSVPPEALSRRVESATAGSNGFSNSPVSNRTQSVNITPPSWAQTVSVMAIGTSSATAAPIRLVSHVTISGQDGPDTEGASDLSITIPAAHVRTFAAAGQFTVSVFAGVQGSGATATLFQSISVMVTYVKSS